MESHALRWSVMQRFLFLEQRLYWDGRLNKSDLIERFEISVPQATADIAHYLRQVPDNMGYDNRVKAFLPSPAFKPKYFVPDARHYLSQLLLLSDHALAPEDSWLGVIPAHDAVPRIRRRLDVQILQSIVRAIHGRKALHVTYQSMSGPTPTQRWIAPHALGFDGARWHVRAWCFRRSMFLDMVLARFAAIGEERPAAIDVGMDREWNEFVDVKLAPHPRLSDAQRAAIALDFGMTEERVVVRMRLALFYYFERNLCLDLPEGALDPQRRQVVLVNRDEIDARRPEPRD